MADGITPTMDHSAATRIMVAAKDRPKHDESPIVSAARTLIRDHERDPSDGTVRVFGGRDEGRLVSAIGRIDPTSSNAGEIEGRLKADVAIQRMGAQRDREIGSGIKVAPFEKRDATAVRGDVRLISNEKSHFTAGNLAMGRFDRIPGELRDWVKDVVSFAGRESVDRARDGVGDRMASIGSFLPRSGVRSQIADSLGRDGSGKSPVTGMGSARPDVASKGGEQPSASAQAFFLDRSGRGR